MASSSTNPETSAETRSAPQDIPQPQQTQTQDAQPNPTPVEMTQIDSKAASTQQEGARRSSGSSPEFPHGPVRTDTRTALDQAQHPPSTSIHLLYQNQGRHYGSVLFRQRSVLLRINQSCLQKMEIVLVRLCSSHYFSRLVRDIHSSWITSICRSGTYRSRAMIRSV